MKRNNRNGPNGAIELILTLINKLFFFFGKQGGKNLVSAATRHVCELELIRLQRTLEVHHPIQY